MTTTIPSAAPTAAAVPTTIPPVVILCGGRGTRAWPLTRRTPKPLLPLGGRPALAHLLEVFARQGLTDFVLAAGHLHEEVEAFAARLPSTWRVRVVDTGEDSGTAERLRRVVPLLDLAPGEPFLATYGDGLGNVDVRALLERHRRNGGATVTAVPLRSQYGCLDVDGDDRVVGFREKPVIEGLWINAGFLLLDSDVLAGFPGDDLEREVLPELSAAGQLHVHRHTGFWASMDTAKDVAELDRLAAQAAPPWHLPPGRTTPAEPERVVA